MSIRFTTLVLLVSAAGADADDRESFEKHVAPFLRAHCVGCHGPQKAQGKLTLHDLKPDTLASGLAAGIVERVRSGEMPPKGKPRPGDDETRAFLAWVEARATPPHGNAVEH